MVHKMSKHEIIEKELLDKISAGVYQTNDILPKEIDLAKHYGVSRPTVRQAIQSLVNKGYLERKKRKGTYVINHEIDQEFMQIVHGFQTQLTKNNKVSRTKVLVFREMKANEEIAEALHIHKQDDVYKLIRLRYAEEDPVVLITTYIPKSIVPGLDEFDFSNASLYSVLSDLNLNIDRIRRRLNVIRADGTTSDLLEIDEGAPVFYFHSVGFTSNHAPIEYSISKFRGDMNSFIFELTNTK